MTSKRKLIWHIFPSFLVIIVLSLLSVTYYSTRYYKKLFLANAENELTIRANLLQIKFEEILPRTDSPIDPELVRHMDKQCKHIGEKTGTRVTLVLPSGGVVGDSFRDIETMENHLKRPEIREALEKTKGVAIRHSGTLDTQMMYIALPVIHNGRVILVVRTAVSVSAIDSKIKALRNNIFLALGLTLLAAAIASLAMARRITLPMEQMKKGAARFAQGDLTARLAIPDSEELSQLALTMNHMAQKLDEKIKAFENRSMELEAIHASMQEGVIAIDKEERIITLNRAAAKLFDLPAPTLKSRYILEVARNLAFQKFIQQALATHEPVEDDIVVARDQDLILNIHSTALYDTGNRRMGTLIIFHDITRIRRLETMHKEFAANVSHELKTPLTSIKGFIETLQEMPALTDTGERDNFLKIIEKNVNRMIDLIDDLLALARLERMQGTDIQFEPQPLEPLILDVIHTCHAAIQAKNIQVTLDCPKDITARVDPIPMAQALINLVDNAVKYSRENTAVEVIVTPHAHTIEILVQDQGCGIDPAHFSKIFNRFYRVDKARSRHEGGTGLGLAIVKHIVQYHQGRIEVTRGKNRGSTFKIILPHGKNPAE